MRSVSLLLLIAIVVFFTSAASAERIVISPNLPADIPENATLRQAAEFAWQEFIALNWPARNNRRDTPKRSARFGDPRFKGPLVWHTYRHKVEIYPGQGEPAGFSSALPDFGYNDVPPVYTYGDDFGTNGDGQVAACPGQQPVDDPAYLNLDETSQIGLATLYAGSAPRRVRGNSDPQRIRYLAKANKVYYEYAVDPGALEPDGDALYTHPQPCPTHSRHTYCVAQRNFTAVSTGNGNPVTPPGITVNFPAGTIMVKGAWRELSRKERRSGRFYQTRVRFYEDNKRDPGSACYREATWGLVGLHIIHKTANAPSFVFATYEQTDNLLTRGGRPVEDLNGREVRRYHRQGSTSPGLSYADGTPPILDIDGRRYCRGAGKRLHYQENPAKTGLPSDGEICQNFRDNAIPGIIVRANRDAHRAIRAYNRRNHIARSPWLYYKLVNVQAMPFDKTEISKTDTRRLPATYYQANSTVETDYTLQLFSGRIDPTGPPTNLPPNFDKFNPDRNTYQNVLTFEDNVLNDTFNMGGCMGCHGIAQLGGNDFSFTLGGGRVAEPEAPTISAPGTSNPAPVKFIGPRR